MRPSTGLPAPPVLSPPPLELGPAEMPPGAPGEFREIAVGAAFGLAVLYTVTLLALQMALTGVQMFVGGEPSTGPWPTLMTMVLASAVILALTPLLLGRSRRELIRWEVPGAMPLVGSLLIALGAWFWALEIGIVTEQFWPMPRMVAAMFEDLFSTADPIGSFLLLVVFPPLVEESLCRGMVLRAMLQHWRPGWAIVASALVFGAIHLNPWQFFYATWIGLALGWVYARTASLSLCMIMHAINNALAWQLARWRPEWVQAPSGPAAEPPDHLPILLLVGASLLLVAGVVALRRTPPARVMPLREAADRVPPPGFISDPDSGRAGPD